jgi:hypothetical protein
MIMHFSDLVVYAKLELIETIDPGVLQCLFQNLDAVAVNARSAATLGHSQQRLHQKKRVFSKKRSFSGLIEVEECLVDVIR